MPSLDNVDVSGNDVDAVLARLRSDDRDLQSRALVELRKLSRGHLEAQAILAAGVFPRIVQLAAVDDVRLQENCASVFNNLASFSQDNGAALMAAGVVAAVVPLLASPHLSGVRLCAVKAVRTISRQSRDCLSALLAQGALELLLSHDNFDQLGDPARRELQSASFITIASLLAHPTPLSARAFEFVVELTARRDDPDVVAAACAMLTKDCFHAVRDEAVARLRILFEHPSERVRAEVAQACFQHARTNGIALLIKHNVLPLAVQMVDRADDLSTELMQHVCRLVFAASTANPPQFPGVAVMVEAGLVPAAVRHSGPSAGLRSLVMALTNVLFQADTAATNAYVRAGIVRPLVSALVEVFDHNDLIHRVKAGVLRVLVTAEVDVLRQVLDAPDSMIAHADLARAIQETTAGDREALIGAVFRRRAAAICLGLQELELPALVTLEILDAAVANSMRMASKWQMIVCVKHFHDRGRN